MFTLHLIKTWHKICQALGTEFEPYLPAVMPLVISIASTGMSRVEHNIDFSDYLPGTKIWLPGKGV
jgi:hypothetical protein